MARGGDCTDEGGTYRKLTLPTPEMEPGLRVTGSPGQRFWPDRVGSRVSVSAQMFDPVLSFNMRIYRDVVSTE